MNQYIEYSFILICCLALVAGGFAMGFIKAYEALQREQPKSIDKPILNVTGNCTNMTLPEAAQCYRNYVNTFYNYTVRNDSEKTLEDIQQNGGDCYDYSLLYVRMAEQNGFRAIQVVFQTDNMTAHAVAIISDENYGYCLLDQTIKPVCVTFGSVPMEEARNDTLTV